MTPTHTLDTSIPLFSATLLSLMVLGILAYVHFIKKISQHILISFLKIILLSDIVYTLSGLFLYYADLHGLWIGHIETGRSYFRLVSIAAALGLVSMIKTLGLSDDDTENKIVPREQQLRIFILPLILVLPFRKLNMLYCIDILCSNGVDESSINFLPTYAVILLAVGSVCWLHHHVIKELKAKWGENSTITVNDLRELWAYPIGLCLCYFWIFLDTPIFEKNAFIRCLDVFGQQAHGLMHCLVFGMSYETRCYLKKLYKEKTKGWKIFQKNKESRSQGLELRMRLMQSNKSKSKRYVEFTNENL
jgi:hypothetical protein